MNYIKYTECPISINGERFFATTASLSSSAAVSPDIVEGGGLESYNPNSALTASVNFNYYVTGSNDSVMALTGDASSSGSFGGINFSGAYLSSYSISISPYVPVHISAGFSIFSGYSQVLSADPLNLDSIEIANGAKTELLNINEVNVGMDNPVDISYSINCERSPSYIIGQEHPSHVLLGKVSKEMTLRGENIGSLINYSGRDFAKISITPKTINGLSRGQSMTCGGIIREQALAVSAGGTAEGTISILERVR